jgi:hypothetical protein
MNITSYLFIIFCLITSKVFTQNVGINSQGNLPENSAGLDVNFPNKGFLAPRIVDTTVISQPAEGLLIYDLGAHCYRYRTNYFWTSCITGGGNLPPAVISNLLCSSSINSGVLVSGLNLTASTLIPYLNGNGGFYNTETLNSTGVTGLTATIQSGILSSGSGNLLFSITGTPIGSGLATFSLSIGGIQCSFSRIVLPPGLSKGCNTFQTIENYDTIVTNLTGTNKTWLSRNLGALVPPNSKNDVNDLSAGCYFLFNRSTAYGADNATIQSNPVFIGLTQINETTNWQINNDPCRTQLGGTWRIPTSSELSSIDVNWNSDQDAFNSILKLHDAGYLEQIVGTLSNRGSVGRYWSSTNWDNYNGVRLRFDNSQSNTTWLWKPYGVTVRCIKD